MQMWKPLRASHYWNGPPLVPETDYLVWQEATHGNRNYRHRSE